MTWIDHWSVNGTMLPLEQRVEIIANILQTGITGCIISLVLTMLKIIIYLFAMPFQLILSACWNSVFLFLLSRVIHNVNNLHMQFGLNCVEFPDIVNAIPVPSDLESAKIIGVVLELRT